MNENFGYCRECKEKNTGLKWCQSCNAKRLEAEFPSWTSSNEELDKFLRETQLTARCWQEVFEWIPYANITEVEEVGRGGYGIVYKSKWEGGCIIRWMPKEKKWARWGTELVALKCLNSGLGDFMHELKILHKFTKFNPNGFECYGITQDPNTYKYFIVTDYYEDGDLRHYFRYHACNLNWSKKLDMLLQLARDLRNIHNANLVHKDFHSGNVLVDDITCIADLGQSQDVEILQTSTKVNGVMPYVAPEVLRERPYTKAADIYSFGIIMWEFTSFQLPFPERPHDIDLVFSICDGLRPKLIEGTPPCYVKLMQQCWNSDPKERPTAEYIVNILKNWVEDSDENVANQFKTADELNSVNLVRERSQPVHKSAIYTSRLLPTIPITNSAIDYSTCQFDFTLPEEN